MITIVNNSTWNTDFLQRLSKYTAKVFKVRDVFIRYHSGPAAGQAHWPRAKKGHPKRKSIDLWIPKKGNLKRVNLTLLQMLFHEMAHIQEYQRDPKAQKYKYSWQNPKGRGRHEKRPEELRACYKQATELAYCKGIEEFL